VRAADLRHGSLPEHPTADGSLETGVVMREEDPDTFTLARRMEQEGPLPLREALCVFRRVAEAVSVFHGRGRAYGMLRPGAIYLEEDSEVLLRSPEQGPEEADEMAEKFFAPELSEGSEADTRCDIYSLGKLLHWILTGWVPNGSGVSGRLPEELGSIVARAVREDPGERTQTVSALTDALDALDDEDLERLEGDLELAVSAAGFDPRLLWKRHPKKVVCCIVVLLLGGLCGGWFYRRHMAALRRQAVREKKLRQRRGRERTARERNERGHLFYEAGKFRDAVAEFKVVAEQDAVPKLREQALCFLARSYRQLKDYGAEYGAWMRLLRRYPDTAYLGEANQRIARIASLTLKRYGDLVRIETPQSILVDGLANDWAGIKPIIRDEKGDNLRGGRPSDLTAFYAAVKDERIYFRFDTAGPPHEGDQFCVAIDLNAMAYEDSSEEWDYQIGVARGIPPWIWDLRGNRSYKNARSERLHGVEFAQKNIVEFSVPLSALGSPCSASLRVFTNYQRRSRPNDMCRRKVLVEWCSEGGGKDAAEESPESDGPPPDTDSAAEPKEESEKQPGAQPKDKPPAAEEKPGSAKKKPPPLRKKPREKNTPGARKAGAKQSRPESKSPASNQK
jgi:tetratricopeptide (TPR) repeat protein